MIKEKGWQRVILESDCPEVVQAIRSSAAIYSYFGRVIDECRNLLNHRVILLKFVQWSANTVAHYLAKSTCSLADRRWNKSNAHTEFLDVLMSDLLN